LQFDLRAATLAPLFIDSVAGVRMAAMQLSTDGKIYVSRTNNLISKRDSLGVIYNPNRPGTACNFNLLDGIPGSMFSLAGRYSIYSLPNVVQSFVHVPVFTWDSVCEGDATRFKITNSANTDSVQWSFGDGAVSGNPDPIHAFGAPGVYQVRLTQYYNGEAYTDSMAVTNYANPVISLTDTVLLYSGSSINLHAGGGFVEYLWTTGSVDSILTVSTEGSYGVSVKDIHCCTSEDTTYVKVFGYYIPNAFTPNGDGLNDEFRVTGLYRNISFSMYIYNRWGELVFTSDDIDKGWNGICGGQYCPADSYVWIINIGFLGQDIVTQGDVVFKGTVTIVR
jgi:gliding motility-associated-like protein